MDGPTLIGNKISQLYQPTKPHDSRFPFPNKILPKRAHPDPGARESLAQKNVLLNINNR